MLQKKPAPRSARNSGCACCWCSVLPRMGSVTVAIPLTSGGSSSVTVGRGAWTGSDELAEGVSAGGAVGGRRDGACAVAEVSEVVTAAMAGRFASAMPRLSLSASVSERDSRDSRE